MHEYNASNDNGPEKLAPLIQVVLSSYSIAFQHSLWLCCRGCSPLIMKINPTRRPVSDTEVNAQSLPKHQVWLRRNVVGPLRRTGRPRTWVNPDGRVSWGGGRVSTGKYKWVTCTSVPTSGGPAVNALYIDNLALGAAVGEEGVGKEECREVKSAAPRTLWFVLAFFFVGPRRSRDRLGEISSPSANTLVRATEIADPRRVLTYRSNLNHPALARTP